jgi:hypothetical protein
MSRPSRVVVLLEDDHQRMLLYRYLKRCGLAHVTTILPSPSGKGSAEQWVRKRFIEEVIAYRVRQAKAKSALIVVIDADRHTVQDRLRRLDQALKDDGKPIVDQTEQVARLVPKRNIETWVLCLLNVQAVNEETDYKRARDDWNELMPSASEALFEWTRPNAELPNYCIASLRSGVRELGRLIF